MTIQIQNVVASAAFNQTLDLNAIAYAFPQNTEVKGQFPGLIFRLKTPKTTMLIFHAGKMVCTGAKSGKAARGAVLKVVRNLKKGGIVIDEKPEIQIMNIVASATIGEFIDLERLYISERGGMARRIIYEPEQFPALIYRWKNPEVVFLIFSTGRIVCVGAKKEEEIYEATEKLVAFLEEKGVLIKEA